MKGKMREIARDIIHMKIDPQVMQALIKMFHDIARKHGLRAGEEDEGSVTMANFEWTMAKDTFLQQTLNQLQWELLMDVPDDLVHYDNEEE
jgi:hypothetical protein